MNNGFEPTFLGIVTLVITVADINSVLQGLLIIATLVLLFFAIFGSYLLKYLGISFNAFTIAGGIILFIISLQMLFDIRTERRKKSINEKRESISIFPIAIPLLAGPAAITSVILAVSSAGENYSSFIINLISLTVVSPNDLIDIIIVLHFK